MAYPVLAIIGQIAEKAAESEVVRSAVSVLEKIEQVKAGVSETLVAKVEAAAHIVGKFFGFSDADLVLGRAIEAYHECDVFVNKAVWGFVFDRFKDVTGVSIEDITKIWAHECGCKILEKDNSLSPWAKELGADFFTGARSEMLGLPNSGFEKMLESAKGSERCPGGNLRVNAIQHGREVVRFYQSNGIEPTFENCKKAFENSPYSKITCENYTESNYSAWVDKTDLSQVIKINSDGLVRDTEESGLGVNPQFEKLSEQFKAGLSDKALEARVEAAAHSACIFFDIPDADLIKGDAIGVYRDCDVFLDNDVFEYNLDQFKDMKCVSFEDMTKIWAHECGHRILGKELSSSRWTQELFADFCSGVRSETLGLPSSNFEKMLGSTKGSETHPVGSLRVNAIQFGREVVRFYQSRGVESTIEDYKEAFANSPFSKITYENYNGPQYSKFIDDKGGFKIKLRIDDEGKTYCQNGELVPNNEYKLNGYFYKTDELGRTTLANGTLTLKEEITNRPAAPEVKGMDENDQKGHLIGREFNGADAEGNFAAMSFQVNKSDFRTWELDNKKLLKEGKDVKVTIECVYDGDSYRPSSFIATREVDGEFLDRREFNNESKQ